MTLGTYEGFEQVIEQLQEKGLTQDQYFSNYLLQPFISRALEYDLYDIQNTSMMDSGSTFCFNNPADEHGVNVYVSLRDKFSRYRGDTDRVWLYLDMRAKRMVLYFRVFDAWHEVNRTQFFVDDVNERAEAEDAFISICDILYAPGFRDNYMDRGEKYFTSVVLDNLIEQGNVLNIFVRQALVNELKNPGEPLILMLTDLLKEYSTQSSDWIQEKLEVLKETSAVELIDEAVKRGELEITSVAKPEPQPQTRRRSNSFLKETQQVVDMSPKEVGVQELEKLRDVGFGVEVEEDEVQPLTEQPKYEDDVESPAPAVQPEPTPEPEVVYEPEIEPEPKVIDPFEAAGFEYLTDEPDERKDGRAEDGTVDLSQLLD